MSQLRSYLRPQFSSTTFSRKIASQSLSILTGSTMVIFIEEFVDIENAIIEDFFLEVFVIQLRGRRTHVPVRDPGGCIASSFEVPAVGSMPSILRYKLRTSYRNPSPGPLTSYHYTTQSMRRMIHRAFGRNVIRNNKETGTHAHQALGFSRDWEVKLFA